MRRSDPRPHAPASPRSPRLALPLCTLLLALAACSDPPVDTATSSPEETGGGPSTGDEPTPTTGVAPTTSLGEASTSAADTGEPASTGVASTGAGTTGDDTTGAADVTSTGDATSTTGTTGDGTTGAVDEVVKVQLLAINDLHGNLEPPAGSSGTIKLPDDTLVDAGGAAYLATHVAALRADNPNTIVVSAGDMIGGTPLISALFHDEPTIEVLNQIGLQYSSVGNHEFDEGATELLRMQVGGCHPIDGCADGTPFPGANFQYLAANVLVSADEPIKTLFPGYVVHEVDGVRVGILGMTLEGTPDIVTPQGIAGLTFVDEVERANALVPELVAMGVEAIVVLIHEGGYQPGYYDQCEGIAGPIVDIATNMSDEVDVLITGHTHSAYNCEIAGKVVTSAASFGRLITDIDLEISALTGDVTAVTAANVIVTRDQADPEIAAFVADYKDLAAPLANAPIGTITGTLERYAPMMKPGLSTMGAVIADAQLAATSDVMLGGSEVAFMNPGGVRADLLYAAAPNEPQDGIVSYGEAFTVQPFANSLVVMTLTGAQIKTMLEQQWQMGLEPKILHVSLGFTYSYSLAAPMGAKVDAASMKLGGVPIDPAAEYRVTVNSFLAGGGDKFSVLLDGTDRIGGANDLDALVAYFAANSPVAPPPLDRITELP